jgi:2-keto-4-pentenoate hydratase
MQATAADQVADIAVAAMKAKAKRLGLPDSLKPGTMQEAYAVQDAILRRLGPPGGWKVAPAKPGADPRCAPIPASMVFASPKNLVDAPPEPEIEIEIAARMARDLPPRATPYTLAEVTDAIGSLHPAIEVLYARFGTRGEIDPMTLIADLQGAFAIVYGPALSDWRKFDFTMMDMTLSLSGVPYGQPKAGPETGKVLEAIAWLANHAVSRTGGLKAGQIIITGARIKHPGVPAGTLLEAEIKGLGKVAARF